MAHYALRFLPKPAQRALYRLWAVRIYSASITACVTSRVRALPPRSGVNTLAAVTISMAFINRAAALGSPRCSSIIDAVQKVAMGLATPLPVMSKAEPWIGSNMDGNLRSGVRLVGGAL